MGEKGKLSEDYEYQIMEAVKASESVSQRDLATSLGVSLGTINLLLSKMAKEGLIKIEKVSTRQVLYMLTPKGAFEKAQKTMSYLKVHYQAITTMKENFKDHLEEASEKYDYIVFSDLNDMALQNTLATAVEEYQKKNQETLISFGLNREFFNSSDRVLCLYHDEGEETDELKKNNQKIDFLHLTLWM